MILHRSVVITCTTFFVSICDIFLYPCRLNYGDEMTQTLRHWRKRRFSIQEEKRLSEELELQGYLSRLIREDRDRKVSEFEQSQKVEIMSSR